MPWNLPDTFTVEPVKSSVPSVQIDDAEAKKHLFGIELAKGKQAFEAALIACGQQTNQALYISQHWLNDPIVLAEKEKTLKAVYSPEDLLDADQLAANLLRMANEKDRSGSFYMFEGKDRLAALKLYAEVRGFIGKQSTQINNNIVHKSITVKFVKPQEAKEEETVIEQLPDENLNLKSIPKLKLVS